MNQIIKVSPHRKNILFTLLVFIFCSMNINAKNASKTSITFEGTYYLNVIFGHVHINSDRNSRSLTTIACGHPVRVYRRDKSKLIKWSYVKIGGHEGFVLKEFLSKKKPHCFQDKYPLFFNALELNISDLYFWGKLHESYIQGKADLPF